MEPTSTIGTLLLFIIGLTTYKGFKDRSYKERYIFNVDQILRNKEYGRLFSSGFFHANWLHFGFNMIALMSFSFSLELVFGIPKFIFIYVCSLIGGSLLALYIHRNHGDYSALGASGAISGIVLSSVMLFPESKISLILIPIEFSSWVFGLLFIVISIFGIKSQADNIGHEAHLGGALAGVLATLSLEPSLIWTNWWVILMILVPILLFLALIINRPEVLLIDNYWGFRNQTNKKKTKPIISPTKEKEQTLNFLLDKIRKEGMDSLSKKERNLLDQLKDEL